MENQEIKAALVMLLNQVNAMREAQKYYFKNRSKQAFYTSINMEKMVDDSIPRLYAYVASIENNSGRERMNQTPPDLSGQEKDNAPTEDTESKDNAPTEDSETKDKDPTNDPATSNEGLPF